MRNALAQTLFELAKEDDRIVVLVADISPAGAMDDFRKTFPSRFYNVGVAEQAMTGIAAGLAMRGFKVFIYTIATFALFRNYEFIRCDLAYQDLPVTIVGMGAGLSYSTLGGTHQAVEDVAVAMACPNLTVLAPCDPAETAECARWCAGRESGGPVYMRIGKAGEEDLTRIFRTTARPWEFGGMRWWAYSRNLAKVTILSYGPMMDVTFDVAEGLEKEFVVDVACCSTLTQFAEHDLMRLHNKNIVTIEEAAGAPLAAAIRERVPYARSVRSFALPREFAHMHGTRGELLDHYGLTAEKIIKALRS